MKLDNIATASLAQANQENAAQKGDFDAQVDAKLAQLKPNGPNAPNTKELAAMQEASNSEG